MPDRRRFAVVATPLLALISVAAAILLPSGAAPAAAQSAGPTVVCFEITVGWRICVAPTVAPAQPPGPCATGAAVPDAANKPGLVADCTALLAAKDTLRGTAALDWDAGLAIPAWDGVTVRGTPPRVTELRLGSRGLTGPIPAALGNLAQLEYLALYGNRLTGAMPPALGALARLERLSLSGNRLSGPIPPELGNLAQLEYLALGRNRLTGAIPPELGDLTALADLILQGNQLTGAIPPGLADLPLSELSLSENDLTGCLPRELTQVERNDVAYLGLASCPLRSETLTYGPPVTTGSVTDDGDYAFLTDPDDLTTLVTTYEGLRDGSTTGLVIHKNDSAGASQADFYDLVEAGDIVEWRQASDCFVRYTVTEVKDDPAGDPPRKLLAVAWMTYAFTGCSGAISPTATASLQWGPLPALGGTSLTAPVVHGIYQIVPTSWTGETEDPQPREGEYTEVLPGRKTTIAEARLLPRWRDPDLPSGWVFLHATSGFSETPFGYQSWWATDEGYLGIIIRGEQAGGTGFIQYATGRYTIGGNRKLGVAEARTIAGRPAIISYSPAGPTNDIDFLIRLRLHDPATDSEYTILTYDRSLGGSNVDAVIAIAESLFEPPNAP